MIGKRIPVQVREGEAVGFIECVVVQEDGECSVCKQKVIWARDPGSSVDVELLHPVNIMEDGQSGIAHWLRCPGKESVDPQGTESEL
jgi:hypothetical protein